MEASALRARVHPSNLARFRYPAIEPAPEAKRGHLAVESRWREVARKRSDLRVATFYTATRERSGRQSVV